MAKKSEKEMAKELMPSWHKKAREQALKEVKNLLKQIKTEPLPDEFAVAKENKEMVQQELALAQMLKPLKSIEGSPLDVKRPATRRAKKQSKKKIVRKKRKK